MTVRCVFRRHDKDCYGRVFGVAFAGVGKMFERVVDELAVYGMVIVLGMRKITRGMTQFLMYCLGSRTASM